ncbi:MAG: Cu(I)-responsive transcriptional regulator [Gammaproteobacteria bacterium]|nr:Cu(I)-responsive transcriptional regulator [Gammaproteobacteria bacterium]
MNIGEAALATCLPAKTIRYYEDIGLVVPARRANGYRDYSEETIHKLRFVKRARDLGFATADCRRLLDLYENRDRASKDVRGLALERMEEIDRKIAALTQMRRTLAHLVDSCSGDSRPDCPILEDLAGRPGP